jgi:prevent-host-death family protein
MRRATITEAKNGLSALIDRVKAGETVLILDRGRPVARLAPATDLDDSDGRLTRLERAGLVRRGIGPPPTAEMLARLRPSLPPGVSIVDDILEDRREGR